MTDTSYHWIRWLALVPAALLATVIVKIGAEAVFRYVLVATFGLESWTPSLAKGLSALLMGAAFVLAARAIAPSAKVGVSALALGVVTVWGVGQVLAAGDAASLNGPVAAALGGVLGSALTFALLRRFAVSRPG